MQPRGLTGALCLQPRQKKDKRFRKYAPYWEELKEFRDKYERRAREYDPYWV